MKDSTDQKVINVQVDDYHVAQVRMGGAGVPVAVIDDDNGTIVLTRDDAQALLNAFDQL